MQDLILGETPKPYVFLPMAQAYQPEMTLVVHTAHGSVGTRAIDAGRCHPSSIRACRCSTFARWKIIWRNGQALLFTRVGSAVASVFGLLALVLATVGVYGVVSYSVAQRSREIGVRMALGARRGSILTLVVGQGMRLAWAGVGVGFVMSIAAMGVVSSVLYGVAPRDPLVLGSVVALLVAVVAVASLIPARRAMRIDPIVSLRSQ